MPNPRIPALVKHMTIAIYREGKISARGPKDRFKKSFEIAKSRCQQYGFVTFAGQSLSEAIGMTSKGRKADMRHRTEGRAKTVLFDLLYDQFDIDGVKAAAAKKEQEKEAARVAEAKEANKSVGSRKNRL